MDVLICEPYRHLTDQNNKLLLIDDSIIVLIYLREQFKEATKETLMSLQLVVQECLDKLRVVQSHNIRCLG